VTPLASAFQEKVLYQGAAHSQRGAALVAAAPLLSRWLKQLLATGLQFNTTMAKNAEAMGERLAELTSRLMWIALPMITMLLSMNLVMGVISRIAQQMNIFAVGFPITLGVGLVGVLLTLPMMQAPFTMALEQMLSRFQ
jgi:flagellar biosynthesis protein FliR